MASSSGPASSRMAMAAETNPAPPDGATVAAPPGTPLGTFHSRPGGLHGPHALGARLPGSLSGAGVSVAESSALLYRQQALEREDHAANIRRARPALAPAAILWPPC